MKLANLSVSSKLAVLLGSAGFLIVVVLPGVRVTK
jgi:hypothetical protein